MSGIRPRTGVESSSGRTASPGPQHHPRRRVHAAYVLRGTALDVDGYSSTVGLHLQQWTSSGGTNQQWYVRPAGDGYFTITSHDSGLAADVYGWETGDNPHAGG